MSDEELMARYVAGEEAAFRQLFERHGPRVAGVARRHLAREDDVQDLVQQTFFQLHRARHDFRPGAQVRPWLFAITFNLLRRHWRDAPRRAGQVLEVEPAGGDLTASGEAMIDEASERLRQAVGSLATQQREVLELHWFEGLPFAEVARRLGANVGAVKVRAHRAYERLRAELGEV